MRILVPLMSNDGEDSELSPHFGRAPFFAVWDAQKDNLEIFENTLDHSNPSSSPIDQLMKHDFDVVYAVEMGGKALRLLKEKNIKIKTGKCKILKEITENINCMEDLTSGCGH